MCGCKNDKINAVEQKKLFANLLIKIFNKTEWKAVFCVALDGVKDLNLIIFVQFEKWFSMSINDVILGIAGN